MGILSGVVSYIFGLALNLLDAVIDGFLGALGFDLDTFETFFPAAKNYYDVIIGFAVGLLFIMLIFQIFRNFGIVLDMEVEDPLKMLGKTMLFFGMIMYSRSISNFILKLLTDPYAIFMNAASSPYEFKLLTLVTSMFTSVFSNPFTAVVALILMLILGWQFLKLTIECVERYIVFYFVLYCAPVVFATGAFKSTAQIFKSWCRMLASQALLLLLNIWSIKLFMSYLPVLESNSGDLIFNFLMGYAFLKFAQKADTLLRILGLNTASTGSMMNSLGGTIAGIAMTIKSISGMAGSVATAAGKIFGGGAAAAADAAANAAGAAGGAGARGAANVISGMLGGSGFSPRGGTGGSAPNSGVTDSGIGSAKQNYADEVLNSAKSQLDAPEQPYESIFGGGGFSRGGGAGRDQAHGFSSRGTFGGRGGDSGQSESSGGRGGGGRSGRGINNTPDSEIQMKQDGTRDQMGAPQRIDAETTEGLANLAHGLPHNSYDPDTKTFSGGGFKEFTGKEANVIGASQLTAADGFEQYSVKMQDGSLGTVYQNKDTGDAHLVQFGSVDNGVIQGTISEIDRATGKPGDAMAFKAVHGSVPGAESFSNHSVPVADSEGGVYHLSTGADTSFFDPGGNSVMQGAGPVDAPANDAPPVSGSIGSPSAASPPDVGSIFNGGSSRGSGVGRSQTDGFSGRGTFGGRNFGGSGESSGNQGEGFGGRRGGGGRRSGGLSDETPQSGATSYDSPAVHSGMKQKDPAEARRFSKNNPANVEVFQREGRGVESFDRSQANPDTIPNMDSSND